MSCINYCFLNNPKAVSITVSQIISNCCRLSLLSAKVLQPGPSNNSIELLKDPCKISPEVSFSTAMSKFLPSNLSVRYFSAAWARSSGVLKPAFRLEQYFLTSADHCAISFNSPSFLRASSWSARCLIFMSAVHAIASVASMLNPNAYWGSSVITTNSPITNRATPNAILQATPRSGLSLLITRSMPTIATTHPIIPLSTWLDHIRATSYQKKVHSFFKLIA